MQVFKWVRTSTRCKHKSDDENGEGEPSAIDQEQLDAVFSAEVGQRRLTRGKAADMGLSLLSSCVYLVCALCPPSPHMLAHGPPHTSVNLHCRMRIMHTWAGIVVEQISDANDDLLAGRVVAPKPGKEAGGSGAEASSAQGASAVGGVAGESGADGSRKRRREDDETAGKSDGSGNDKGDMEASKKPRVDGESMEAGGGEMDDVRAEGEGA